MTYSHPVRALRLLYYTYLTLLPSAATFFILADSEAQITFGKLFLIAFLPLLVYLDIVIEIVPFPQRLSKALITFFASPLQVLIATLLFNASVADFFIHEFFVEVLGIMAGILVYALFERGRMISFRHEAARLILALLWFGGGFVGFIYIFLPRIIEAAQGNILSGVFLIGAIITSCVTYIRRMKYSEREIAFWPLIILGLFTWFIAGGFGQAMQNSLK